MTDVVTLRGNPRLLFVANVSTYFVTHRLELARRAREAGCEVHVATRIASESDARAIAAAGIILHETRVRRGSDLLEDLRGFLDVYRLMRRVRFDIVHVVTIKFIVIGGVAARLARARAIVAAATGLGQVFTEPGFWPALRRRLVVRLIRFVAAHPRCLVIFQNDEDRALLTGLGAVRASQTRLIRGSGVDTRAFLQVPEPARAPRVLLPARMLRSKGVEEFIAAAGVLGPRWPGVEFLLAGDLDPENPTGLTAPELERLCAANGTQWLGHVADMPALLASVHIVVLASQDREGLPKSLLEAAAAGRPIVGSDIPGVREIVVPEVNGLRVRPRDSAQLAAAIERLLADAELRQRFGAAGRELVEKNFGLDLVIESTLNVYRELPQMTER